MVVGTVTVDAAANASVTGVAATGEIGNVVVWSQIIPAQNANWGNLTPSQTPDWQGIAASQTPDWQEIAA